MSNYRAQVVLRTSDNVPENFITNTLAFRTFGEVPLNTDEVTVAIKDFYDDLVSYYSVAVAQNGHMIKYYELPGLTPNYPFEEDTFNLAAPPAGSGLPSEVSLVLSFQGIRQAGFPQARRRGRIYIGPLDTSGMDDQRPLATFVTNLANAGATFKANIQAITGGQHNWAIWSSVDQECVDVANGWVDNAWDTQRRRGLRATSRTTFV